MHPTPFLKALPPLLVLALTTHVVFGTLPVAADPTSAIGDLEQAYIQIADKVMPAVVFIQASAGVGSGPFLRVPSSDAGSGKPVRGIGSGFFVSSDGLIMTNSHVVEDMESIEVIRFDKKEYKAKLVGVDRDTDVALLKIEAQGLPFLKLGDSSKLRVGAIVVAVGNPLGLSWSVTSGIISATGRGDLPGLASLTDYIQTNALINPGNSGGPLVDIRGEVVGITTGRPAEGVGLSFAVPANLAKLVMDELVKYHRVDRGYLGIDDFKDLTPMLAMALGLPDTKGTLVTSVVAGSPAEWLGIKPGDVILDCNGEAIADCAHFKILAGRVKAGSPIKLTIFRGGRTYEGTVTLVEHAVRGQAMFRPVK